MVAPVNGNNGGNGGAPAGQIKKTDPTGSGPGGSGTPAPTSTPTTAPPTTPLAPAPAPDTGKLAAGMVLAFQEAKADIESRYQDSIRESRTEKVEPVETNARDAAVAASAGAATDMLSAKPIIEPDAEHTAAMQALDETGKAVRRSLEEIDKQADKHHEARRREKADEAAREEHKRLTGLDQHGSKDPFAFRPEEPEKAPWKRRDLYTERAHEPYKQAMADHRDSRPQQSLLTV